MLSYLKTTRFRGAIAINILGILYLYGRLTSKLFIKNSRKILGL